MAFDINKIKVVGLRLPILAKGWGFDKYGRKIFNEETKLNEDQWLTGAIDFRYDCSRKIWSCGPQYLNMLPHMHLSNGNDISGGGAAFAAFYPGDDLEAIENGYENLCLPQD